MAEDAHHEMDADRLRYEIGHRQMPTVMTVLAWGNEVLLVSSQKGAKSFSYEIPNTPVAETLRLCQAVWRDTGQPDKPHFNDGKCGEIMAVHLYYIMHRRHLGLQKPQARIGTVGLAQGRIVRFPLCPLHKDPVPPVSLSQQWLCRVSEPQLQ
jgi:hypothetical protein